VLFLKHVTAIAPHAETVDRIREMLVKVLDDFQGLIKVHVTLPFDQQIPDVVEKSIEARLDDS
jgi:hypothetical protein